MEAPITVATVVKDPPAGSVFGACEEIIAVEELLPPFAGEALGAVEGGDGEAAAAHHDLGGARAGGGLQMHGLGLAQEADRPGEVVGLESLGLANRRRLDGHRRGTERALGAMLVG